jgi:hypothetical protein
MPTGTLVLPPPHKVVAGFQYGADGTEFAGTYGASSGATPDIEEAVYTRLAGGEAIRAVVGDRIYPDVGDTDAPRPLLLYSLDSTSPTVGLDLSIGMRTHSLTVTAEAIDKDDARALAALVRDRLHGQSWENVKRAYWQDESGGETGDGFQIVQVYKVIQ